MTLDAILGLQTTTKPFPKTPDAQAAGKRFNIGFLPDGIPDLENLRVLINRCVPIGHRAKQRPGFPIHRECAIPWLCSCRSPRTHKILEWSQSQEFIAHDDPLQQLELAGHQPQDWRLSRLIEY